jgi:hypothetical protein
MEMAELTETVEDVATKRAATIPTSWMWAALGIYGLFFGGYWWAVAVWVTDERAAAGQFGDMFGGFNALASGLAMLGVIGALYLQRKQNEMQADELRLQRIELAQTREELKGQKEALETQNKLQLKTSEAALMQQLMNEYDALRPAVVEVFNWSVRFGSTAPQRMKREVHLRQGFSPEDQAVHLLATSANVARHRVSRFFVRVSRLAEAGYIREELVALILDRQAIEIFLLDVTPHDQSVLESYWTGDAFVFFSNLLKYRFPPTPDSKRDLTPP